MYTELITAIILSLTLLSDCLECHVLIYFQENWNLKIRFEKKAEKKEFCGMDKVLNVLLVGRVNNITFPE